MPPSSAFTGPASAPSPGTGGFISRLVRLPGQTVYSKALTLFVALSLLLGTAVVTLTRSIIIREFEETERQEMVGTLQRFAIFLNRETRPVDISLVDWMGQWQKSTGAELPSPATLDNLQLDFLSIADSDGRVLNTVFSGPASRELFQSAPPWTQWIEPQMDGMDPHRNGFISVGNQLVAIAWRRMDDGRLAAGAKIFGEETFAFLEGIFGARIRFDSLENLRISPDTHGPLVAMLGTNELVAEPNGPNELVGHVLIRGINARPLGQVRMIQSRPLYHEGLQAVQIFLTVLTLAGGTLFLVVWFLLDRTILYRIRDLTSRVEAQSTGGSLPLRLEFGGHDELSHLASRIETLAGELARTQSNYRSVVEDQTEVICRFNPSFLLVFANGIFRRLFPGTTPDAFRLSDLLPASTFELLTRKFSALTPSQPVDTILHPVAIGEKNAWFRSTLRANFRADGTCSGGQWVAADITPQVQAQQHLQDSERQLRQLSNRLLRLQDEERRRIARELHDSTAQSLSALEMNMSLLEPATDDEKMRRIVAETRQIARDCCLELRTISYLLHPPLLDEVGLLFAIEWFADGFTKRTSIRVSLELDSTFPRLEAEMETALFRVVQEAMTNVYRHSGASHAWITLNKQGAHIFLEIRDNGSGLSSPAANGQPQSEGVGLAGMRERIARWGGKLEIANSPYGVGITVEIDYHPENAAEKS